MKRVVGVVAVVLALAGVVPAYAEPAAAPAVAAPAALSAKDVVKNFYADLEGVMKQGDKLGFTGRFKKLDPILNTAFNLPLMAKFSIGPVWDQATPVEQQQIVNAFSQFSIATYASRFTKYDGEQFAVTGEQPAAGGTIVETTLTPKDSDAVALNYLMRQDDKGAWRIVDVFMNGAISELATRRAEFSSVIKRDGISALVNALDQKSKAMGPS